MLTESIFSSEELLQLEVDLVEALNSQGFAVEAIKLIGLKGSGSHSTVFSVLIDDVYHVLKVYREAGAYRREIQNLRQQVPLDRLFFVWPGRLHRYKYNIVIVEVPEGKEMHSGDLNPKTSALLARALLNLHSMRYKERVSTRGVEIHMLEKMVSVMAHAADYRSLNGDDIHHTMEQAIRYLHKHAKDFRVPRSRDHGDPWWGNVIVAEEDVYMVDWENVKRDDFCEDLAKFRVLMDYERDSSPTSFWDDHNDAQQVDAFMEDILTRYEAHFTTDRNIRGRYGFYGLHFACVVFGDYYFGDKRGTVEAKTIMRTGLELFERYCVQA